MEDIVVNPKKSLREILPLKNGGSTVPPTSFIQPELNPPRRRRGWWALGLLALALVLALVFSLSNLISHATVTLHPVVKIISPTATFQASQNGNAGVAFQVLQDLTSSLSQNVPASGIEPVSSKASGSVILYNATARSQKLVANTRLQAPNGKIFRLTTAVNIPAYTKKGTTITPGSVEARVVADLAGPDSNLGLVDWTIPGLKGDPNYGKIYARSKTAMTGGATGNQPKVSDPDRQKAVADLEAKLKTQLVGQARATLPADSVLYDQATFLTFTDAVSGTTTPQVTVTGTLSGIIFKTKDLARLLAVQYDKEYDQAPVDLANAPDLKFMIVTAVPNDLSQLQSFNFSLAGEAKVVWIIDLAALKTKLLGQAKDDYQKILQSDPAIKRAEVKVRPPWASHFPTDPNKLDLVIQLDD